MKLPTITHTLLFCYFDWRNDIEVTMMGQFLSSNILIRAAITLHHKTGTQTQKLKLNFRQHTPMLLMLHAAKELIKGKLLLV